MNILLVVVSFAVAVLAEGVEEPNVATYHEDIGIPTAQEIWVIESEGSDGLRIIGGSPASLGEFPYFGGLIIQLVTGKRSVCGSSLLSNTKVVTAAHCWNTPTLQGRQVTVVLGSVRLYSGGTRVTTNRVEVHGGWNPQTARNDIAMITIDRVEYSDVINRIAIATGTNSYTGATATVVVFGKTGDNKPVTRDQTLSYVTMDVITNAQCRQSYGRKITDATLCTSTAGGTRASCRGDSGGPLSVGSGGDRLLIGLVSFGTQSCQDGEPKVATRVTYYASWIRARIKLMIYQRYLFRIFLVSPKNK